MPLSEEDFSKLVGQRIIYYRKQKGITQAELARRCNKARQALERLENGRVNPKIYTIYEIAKALNIHPKRLLDL